MKVKETIAFIGAATETSDDLIRKLASVDYPLVLVAKDDNQYPALSAQILRELPNADVEVVDCAREGCWEADIIVLITTSKTDEELLEKIKEVANQKVMAFFSGSEESGAFATGDIETCSRLLPNTAVVKVMAHPASREMQIAGAEKAIAAIVPIFGEAGFKTSLIEKVAEIHIHN